MDRKRRVLSPLVILIASLLLVSPYRVCYSSLLLYIISRLTPLYIKITWIAIIRGADHDADDIGEELMREMEIPAAEGEEAAQALADALSSTVDGVDGFVEVMNDDGRDVKINEAALGNDAIVNATKSTFKER